MGGGKVFSAFGSCNELYAEVDINTWFGLKSQIKVNYENLFPDSCLCYFSFIFKRFRSTKSKTNSNCDNTCIEKIQTIIDNYRKKHNVPGLQVTLSFANQLMQVFSSGSKTIDGKNPIEANSLFEIGSTTKSFSAAIVLHLVKEGKIKLDDTIGKCFGDEYPSWKDTLIVFRKRWPHRRHGSICRVRLENNITFH
jgi:CubicO group peptidase (beta-lactamase class C family)